MSARSRLQQLERASGLEQWFVATEEAAAELRAQAKREGRPAPDCLVLNDPMADPPIRCTLTHEQAMAFLYFPDRAERPSLPSGAPMRRTNLRLAFSLGWTRSEKSGGPRRERENAPATHRAAQRHIRPDSV